ncbi:hypothetical protein KEM54_000022 [Ascosphaera aggregata]|nr:hypothetical protein KEM54_000022 [Ascosphaera aggregata]
MSSFGEQVWTLTFKNLLIVLIRPWHTTPFRALILPVAFIIFLTFARNLFNPPSQYGIGHAAPILSLSDAIKTAGSGRDKVAFVNNGFTNGDIAQVISKLEGTARDAGAKTAIFSREHELGNYCKTSLRGASSCFGAVVFASSPTEGGNHTHMWNYTIRADGVLGTVIKVSRENNDPQQYTLPLQQAVDSEIAKMIGGPQLPNKVYQFPYTVKTDTERQDDILVDYMGTMVDYLSVGVLLGIIGVGYQLTGLIASERELGMSQLIDCMLPNRSTTSAQFLRLIAAHLALDLVYGPAWIINAIILGEGIYKWTNTGIIVGLHILGGLSLSSFSVFFASFFRKSQISGIASVLVCLVLGIIAQLIHVSSNSAVIILSILFPPMNFVYSMIFVARCDQHQTKTILNKSAPGSDWTVKGYLFLIFFAIQIIVYPLLAIIVERMLYDTQSSGRKETKRGTSLTPAVSLNNYTKEFRPSWFHRNIARHFGSKRRTVRAVNNLTLDIMTGEIMVLLGANGSGKSTTLTAIAGLSKITGGEITLNHTPYSGGFGLCPQYNVLWDSLTVEEHVKIFSRLKGGRKHVTREEIHQLIEDCDLGKKVKAYSRALSGGQKRKLQLAMMFIGGSSICCVDEVSSGIDPISRRKVWDILLAERGKRTILLTTHFLDEANILADHIAIMAKGELKAQGSSVELKEHLGSGYRLHIYHPPGSTALPIPQLDAFLAERQFNESVYKMSTGSQIAEVVAMLEEQGITNYGISPPTIEDVFLKVVQDAHTPTSSSTALPVEVPQATEGVYDQSNASSLQLADGEETTMIQQARILFMKRCTVLRRNWFPSLVAAVIPIIASGCVTLYLTNLEVPQCGGQNARDMNNPSAPFADFSSVFGPSADLTQQRLTMFGAFLGAGHNSTLNNTVVRSKFTTIDTYDQFIHAVEVNHSKITPGGFYMGDKADDPIFVWRADGKIGSVRYALAAQSMFNAQLMNHQVHTNFKAFDLPSTPDMGNALQLIAYSTLAMACYPAFLALYPTLERIRSIRAMHYSNGVRRLSLWLAYLAFDSIIVFFTNVLVIVIWVARSDIWYEPGYLFVVLFLYGIASVILAYIVSMFATSQLAAFAFAAGKQAIDSDITIMHFIFAVFSPISNLTRSMFLSLNMFSILCKGKQRIDYAGDIMAYGGPILYLVLQCFFLFGILLWWDGGFALPWSREREQMPDDERSSLSKESHVNDEALAPTNTGLRCFHLDKKFGKSVAVEDVSFGVPPGEVFALLGPNGAGKSTTIGLIRGDLRPSSKHSDVLVKNVSIIRHRAKAQRHLGVCPQYDAMDQMTVVEQLRFYARIRGVSGVEHNVEGIIEAVGLQRFRNILAAKLSGGNKRKLSLGVALMGNPSVVLLDEPSSGMDAAAKRIMWRTLASIVPGRSLVLTTHSMEEADALANRAGIVSKRILEMGTTDVLRQKYGNVYHVHIVHKQAPHTADEDMQEIIDWIRHTFEGAQIEQKTYHGQVRFTVPAVSHTTKTVSTPPPLQVPYEDSLTSHSRGPSNSESAEDANTPTAVAPDWGTSTSPADRTTSTFAIAPTIGALIFLLEQEKTRLGFVNYSISQTSLDQVFLAIVGKQFDEDA